MSDALPLDDLLSARQAGVRMGTGPQWPRLLAHRGELPAIVTSLGMLFRAEDVDAFLSVREERLREARMRPRGERGRWTAMRERSA